MTSSLYSQMGDVVVPLSAVSDGASLETLCDPALTALLAAFKAILRTKLNPAWSKAAKNISSTIVADAYPYEPNRGAQQMTWQWPGLFMWRTTEQLRLRTRAYELAECTGKLALILPPLPYDVLVKLQPIRVAARTALVQAVKYKGDPSYLSGANILDLAGVESFGFTQAQYGYLPADNLELMHPTLDMTWVMREREECYTTYLSTLTTMSTIISVMSESSTSYTAGNYTDIIDFVYDPTDDHPSGNG